MFIVSGSTSTKTILAPIESGYDIVAMNVIAGMITSSPGSTPESLKPISIPEVQQLVRRAYFELKVFLAAASAATTWSPRVSFEARDATRASESMSPLTFANASS